MNLLDQVQFSLYTPIDEIGGSRNPLGIQGAQTAWIRKFLPQFTVLTSNPRSHGLLCSIYWYFSKNGLKYPKLGFARNFRLAETLWGLAQTQQENRETVININKFENLLKVFGDTDLYSANEIFKKKFDARLFSTISYGTLGFYINPSIRWRMLEEGGKKLTTLGSQLGEAFAVETGFKKLLDEWFSNGINIKSTAIEKFSEKSIMTSHPAKIGKKELKAYEDILNEFIISRKNLHDLWCSGDPNFSELKSNADEYKNYFKELASIYNLPDVLDGVCKFERATALIEFLFEYGYCRIKYRDELPFDEDRKNLIIKSLSLAVAEYINCGSLFSVSCNVISSIAATRSDFEAYMDTILTEHKRIQTLKGKRNYYNIEEILQPGAIDSGRVIEILDETKDDTEVFIETIIYYYRKDWHFEKMARYKNVMRSAQ